MVATMLAAGNGRISMRDVYEMLTIPSKHSWISPIKQVTASALYLTSVDYPPGAIPDHESGSVTDSKPNIKSECDDEEHANMP